MNLNTLEDNIDSTILQRAQLYHAQKAVSELQQIEPDRWQAWVKGSDIYTVVVTIQDRNIMHWSCNCPYDKGPICKHVAATLLRLRDEDAMPNPATSPSKSVQLDRVLENLSQQELKDYLRELITSDAKLLDQTLLRFQHYTGNRESAAKRYRELFDNIVFNYSSYGFIDYRSAYGLSSEVQNLLNTLAQAQIPARDRIDACFRITHGLVDDVVTNIDDSDGSTGMIMSHISDILKASYPELSPAEQMYCFEQTLTLEFDSELANYGLEDYLSELTKRWATDDPAMQVIYLNMIDKSLSHRHNEWQQDALKRLKFNTLIRWNRASEAEAMAEQDMALPEFRKRFVQKAMEQKDFVKARALLEEGIQLAQQKRHPGTVQDWRLLLLEIAEQTNDLAALRAELMQILQNSHFEINYYRKLKASYSAQEWQQARHQYAQKLLGKNTYTNAAIYAEENELQALFDLIRKQKHAMLPLLKQYITSLSKAFPEQVAAVYAEAIRDIMQATGRSVYQQAVQEIKALQKLPSGKNIAQDLISEFRQQYKNRRAMLEIFNKAFGHAD